MRARSGAVSLPSGAGTLRTISSSSSEMPIPSLALTIRISSGSNAKKVVHFLFATLGLGAGQVDLVENRDDLETPIHRQEKVRKVCA